jgi:hypothetical protein
MAFYNCHSLTDVTVEWAAPLSVEGASIFEYVNLSQVTLHIPAGTKPLYEAADVWKAFGTILDDGAAPNGTTGDCRWTLTAAAEGDYTLTISGSGAMGNYSYEENPSPWNAYRDRIKTVILEPGVTAIGDYAFYHFDNLPAVTLPDGVTTIGAYAFSYCSSLSAVTLSEGLTTIGEWAFSSCSSLPAVTLPAGMTSMGEGAFSYCSSLISVTLSAGLKTIGEDAFESRSSLTSVTLSAGLTAIGAYAFSYCSALTDVTLPAGVTTIGVMAFSDCSNLTDVTLPAGLTTIGESAFSYCSRLPAVTLPESVTSIGKSAFSSCSSLTDVTLPAGLTSIGEFAFSSCSSLTDVTLPAGLTTIGNHTFSGCSSLTAVTLPESVTSIERSAFYNCSSLTAVTLPESVTAIGTQAFRDCSSLTDVTVEWAAPLSVEASVFENVNLSQATLRVPAGTSALYDAADVWKDFGMTVDRVTEPPALSVAPQSLDFAAVGGTLPLTVKATVSWTAVVSEAWLSLADRNGDGVINAGDLSADSTLTVRVTAHTGTVARSAAITFTGGEGGGGLTQTVVVTQAAAVEPSLSVAPQSLDFAAVGGTLLLTVKATVSWTAVSPDTATWLSLADRNGDGVINAGDLSADKTLTVRATAHTDTVARSAVITFTGGEGGLTQRVVVTQAAAPSSAEVRPVDSVTLNKTALTLMVGGTERLTAVVLPAEATDRRVSWSSGNPKVVAVSEDDGLLTALSAGEAVVTARTVAGNLTARCTVTVAKQELVIEPDLPSGGQGNIDVSLKIPVNESFSITFMFALPPGFTLERSATVLSDTLQSGGYRLSALRNEWGGWQFQITPGVSARSAADEMTYQNVVKIAYKLDNSVAAGDYTATVSDMDMTLKGSNKTFHENEIRIPVTVPPGATATDVVGVGVGGGVGSPVWYHGGLLHVDTPQREGVTVYSMTGRALYRVQKAAGAAVFDLHGLPRGVLIVRCDSGRTQKIVR